MIFVRGFCFRDFRRDVGYDVGAMLQWSLSLVTESTIQSNPPNCEKT